MSIFGKNLLFKFPGIAESVLQWPMGWTAEDFGFESQQEQKSFLSPQRRDWAWGSFSFHQGHFSGGKAVGDLKLTTQPLSNAEVKNGGAVPPSPVHLHGLMCN
jgi:hypothetical protein